MRLLLSTFNLLPEQSIQERPLPIVVLNFERIPKLQHFELTSQLMSQCLRIQDSVVVIRGKLYLPPLNVLMAGC